MPLVPVKVIALTQEHHGHGASTAAYFLAATLARRQVPVLLADLTARHDRLHRLSTRLPMRNVVIWTPPSRSLQDLPAILARVREKIQDKASCMLLDVDRTTLGEQVAGIDYLLIACSSALEAQKSADRFARSFPSLHDQEHIGVAFSRISVEEVSELPSATPDGLPALGFWPAEYRLAMAEEDAAGPLDEPHQSYMGAIARLAMRLIRLVPLSRL